MPEPDAEGIPARHPATAPVLVRVLQFAVDAALTTLLCLVPLSAMLAVPQNPDGSVKLLVATPALAAILLAMTLISWWYWVLRPSRRSGRTFAMEWFSIRVIGLDGRPATTGQLTVRWVMLAVDAWFFGAVGLLAMLLTSTRQRLGDILAATLVVRSGPEGTG